MSKKCICLKCFMAIFVLLGSFVLSIVSSPNTSALVYNSSGVINLSGGSLQHTSGTVGGSVSSGSVSFLQSSNFSGAWTTSVTVNFSSYIPANSIASIYLRACGVGTSWQGLTSNSYWSLLSQSTEFSSDCTYVEATYYAPGRYNNMQLGTRLFWWQTNARLDVTRISYVTLASEPTAQQLSDLVGSINSRLDTSNYRLQDLVNQGADRYNQLNSLIGTVSSTGNQTTSAVDKQTEQQQQYHDEEKQGLEDAQTGADTGANDSSDQANSSGSTLLEAFTQFVGALTGATPSNCNINGDIGEFKMGTIDLCSLSPPPAFQVISSLMVIGFTVPLSLALGRKMLSMFRSFQT